MQRSAGIYIHIPFCERKCTYCNFNTTDFFKDLAHRYIDAVAGEIGFWGQSLVQADRIQVDTIYFGGGTPSIVDAEQLATLVVSCRDAFELAPDTEITIEVNPAT